MAGCCLDGEPILNDIIEALVFMKCRNNIETGTSRILDSTLSSLLLLPLLPAAAKEKRSHCTNLLRIIEARREEEEEQARALTATTANLQLVEPKTERKKKKKRRKKEDGAGPFKQPKLALEAQVEPVSVLRDQLESEAVNVSVPTDQPRAGELPLTQRFQQLDLYQPTVEHGTSS